MNKLFKLVSTGVIAVTLSSTFAPTLVVLADDSASEVVSVQNSATISTDMGNVILTEISENVYQIIYPDGTIDTFERRNDGVYKNNEFFLPLQELNTNRTAFRAATLNQWYYLGTSRGDVSNMQTINGVISGLMGALLSYVTGGIAFPTVASIIMGAVSSNFPAHYSITTSYVHPQNRQLKTITKYYRNSDYTGYVTTKTSISNF